MSAALLNSCSSRAHVLRSAHRCAGSALRAAKPQQIRSSRELKTVAKAQNDVLGASYANALVELAEEANELDDVHRDIDTLTGILAGDSSVKDHFGNPVVSDEDKLQLLDKISKEGGFSQNTQNFLGLLVSARRFDCIDEIVAAFEEKYCSLTDTQVATLTSAVKLEQEQQFMIAKKLQELTGSKNIKLKPVIDESLIAGFVVEYGSSAIDLSVRGQLSKISNELVESGKKA